MKTTTLSTGIIRNIIWNFAGQGWLILLAFFSTPYIVRQLGIELYGIYTLVGLIAGYFSFLQFGLAQASINHIARALSAEKTDEARAVFWTCFGFYAAMGVIGALLILLLSPVLIDHFFKLAGAHRAAALFALQLTALTFAVALPINIFISVLRAMSRFDVLNRIAVITGTLQVAAILLLLAAGFSLRAVFVAGFVAQCITLLLYLIAVRRRAAFIGAPQFSLPLLATLLRYGGFVTLSALTEPVLAQTEKVFLSSLRSVTSLTYYTVPFGLIARLTVIPSAVLTVLFPVFSRLHTAETETLHRELHVRSTLYMFFIYFYILCFILFYGGDFLNLWIGRDFAQNSTLPMNILVWGGLLNLLATPSTALLLGRGKPQVPAFLGLLEAFVYVPASYFFIRHYGTLGAAVAWTVCGGINTLLLQHAACATMQVSLVSWTAAFFRRSLLPALVCAGLFVAVHRAGFALLHPVTLSGVCAAGALYAVIIWKFALDGDARQRLRAFTQNCLREKNHGTPAAS